MADDFVVITEECMFCGAPPAVAPNLMGMRVDDRDLPHCYFRKQPENDSEIDEAIAGINASCCGAVCYVGSDQNILKKIDGLSIVHRYRPYKAIDVITNPVTSNRPWITTPKPGFIAKLFKRPR